MLFLLRKRSQLSPNRVLALQTRTRRDPIAARISSKQHKDLWIEDHYKKENDSLPALGQATEIEEPLSRFLSKCRASAR